MRLDWGYPGFGAHEMRCDVVGAIGGSQVYASTVCLLIGVTEPMYLNGYLLGALNTTRNAQLLKLDQLRFKIVPRVV